MRSLHYCMLVYLLIGASALQAMHERHYTKVAVLQAERSLEYATYHAFARAVHPVSNLVYDHLTERWTKEKKNRAIQASYAPRDLASGLKPVYTWQETQLQACQQSQFDTNYVAALMTRTLAYFQNVGFQATANDLAQPLRDPNTWMEKAARNWYQEQTDSHKGLSHSKFNNPPYPCIE